jgi:hypothetical protein
MTKTISNAVAVSLILGTALTPAIAADKPARAILFIIDGLQCRAMERPELKNIQALASGGALVRESYLIMPQDSTARAWRQLHSCSIPNPVMLAGTLFLKPGHKMVQECFWPKRLTAHAANGTGAYMSLNRGFSFSMLGQYGVVTDAEVIDWSLDLLRKKDIAFMRIHLQDVGAAGWDCASTDKDVPWKRNIWAKGSPYIAKLEEADRLVGLFVESLKKMGKWNDTLLILTGDHGQADSGAHPLLSRKAWITPLIFVGPGVAHGKAVEYAEIIDIVPTLCSLMGLEPPCRDGASGRVLEEIKIQPVCSAPLNHPRRIKELDELLREFMLLKSKMLLKAEKEPNLEYAVINAENKNGERDGFYSMDHFTDWPEAGNLDHLLETNRRIIAEMKKALEEK